MTERHVLFDIVEEQKRGTACGIPSVCTAHPLVIETALEEAQRWGADVLIECTANQVNQFGGYSGQRPHEFATMVRGIAQKIGLSPRHLWLGGDHLGPLPWAQQEGRDQALANACQVVADYVKAGYGKIHLDPSMPLKGDQLDAEGKLSEQVIATRTAQMCEAAERAFEKQMAAGVQQPPPVYIVGTEVPKPGGSESAAELEVTRPEDFRRTVQTIREAFTAQGLASVWPRVLGVVVQPGVEFSGSAVVDYNRERAATLVASLAEHPTMVFEGHSTDYQTVSALRAMVEDGIAVLKVGPALTFALREALFALSWIEDELAGAGLIEDRADLIGVISEAMDQEPEYWQGYCQGTLAEMKLARLYSLFDRTRYYWPKLPVAQAVIRLMKNLAAVDIPLSLICQFFPQEYWRVREGELIPKPKQLVKAHIAAALRPYWQASLSNQKDGR